NLQASAAGNYRMRATDTFGAVLSSNALLALLAPPAVLYDVDFGAGTNTTKVGPAAIAQGTNDFWNFYTRDAPGGGWLTFGGLSNLKQANGTNTQAGLTVSNAPGEWTLGSSDRMYNSYIYPFGVDATITATNLLPGNYWCFLYP